MKFQFKHREFRTAAVNVRRESERIILRDAAFKTYADKLNPLEVIKKISPNTEVITL